MKKLLLLLLFAALVFQSCNKLSSNIDEDLVPIVFSQAEITKSGNDDMSAYPFNALVLGSKTSNNSWVEIYRFSDENQINESFAIGNIQLNRGTNLDNTFSPEVSYPKEVVGGVMDRIYFKALAPFDAIVGGDDLMNPLKEPNNNNDGPTEVIFDISIGKGQHDIMATLPIDPYSILYGDGIGSREIPSIKLKFGHLLSRINFMIEAESNARTYWGTFQSITLKGNGYMKFKCTLSNNEITHYPEGSAQKSSNVFILENRGMLIPDVAELACFVILYPDEMSTNYTIVIETKNPSNQIIKSSEIDLNGLVLPPGVQQDITISFSEDKKLKFNVKTVDWTEGNHQDVTM